MSSPTYKNLSGPTSFTFNFIAYHVTLSTSYVLTENIINIKVYGLVCSCGVHTSTMSPIVPTYKKIQTVCLDKEFFKTYGQVVELQSFIQIKRKKQTLEKYKEFLRTNGQILFIPVKMYIQIIRNTQTKTMTTNLTKTRL